MIMLWSARGGTRYTGFWLSGKVLARSTTLGSQRATWLAVTIYSASTKAVRTSQPDPPDSMGISDGKPNLGSAFADEWR